LTPACAGLLEPRGSGLGLLNLRLMLKISYARCLGLSPAISSQFSVEMCAASKNCDKFGGGDSRSSMLINLNSLSPVLVMISSMSVPICNRFHTIGANNSKMTSFKGGTPLWRPSSRGTPLPTGTKFCHWKLESLGAAYSKDFVILACTVLIHITSVTDRRTPKRWLRRAMHFAIGRKNPKYTFCRKFYSELVYKFFMTMWHVSGCGPLSLNKIK